MRYDCLIVDDEQMLAQSICEYFNAFGVSAAYVTDSVGYLGFMQEHSAEILLLDINLEKESGFDLCRRIRETSDIPILFLSARQSDDDVIMALGIGGDDYIKKPCALSVMLAKVKAILKRRARTTAADIVETGSIRIDKPAQTVYKNGQEIHMTQMEFRLLCYLAEHPSRLITKEELFAQVWGDGCYTDGTLNVHIRKLREKIEDDPAAPRMITTVWGSGYRFVEESE